jgi:hypothetical protein
MYGKGQGQDRPRGIGVVLAGISTNLGLHGQEGVWCMGRAKGKIGLVAYVQY